MVINIKNSIREKFPDQSKERRKLPDEKWASEICYFLVRFYQEIDRDEVREIVKKEKSDAKKENRHKLIEGVIAGTIKKWLEKNEEFCYSMSSKNSELAIGFIIDDELVISKRSRLDISIRHSDWIAPKHFPIECKCIYGSDRKKPRVDVQEKDVKEYVFDGKDDGGVYRYVTGKYATNQNFGGMMGFLLKGDCQKTITKIKEKLENLVIDYQKITLLEFIPNAIENQPFTFNTTHNRIGENKENILLHHFIFDFTTIL